MDPAGSSGAHGPMGHWAHGRPLGSLGGSPEVPRGSQGVLMEGWSGIQNYRTWTAQALGNVHKMAPNVGNKTELNKVNHV